MTASLKNYKLVYLWYFVINISLSIVLYFDTISKFGYAKIKELV